MMMHHHTKFGYKRYRSSENIIQTNINFDCTQSNPIFSQLRHWLMVIYHQSYCGCEIFIQKTAQMVIFLLYL